MSDAGQGRVREQDDPFAKRTPKFEVFREVGAPLVRRKTLSGPAVTVELIERQGKGTVGWRFRQDRDAFFYFEKGVVACRGALDGTGISRELNGNTRLAFVGAGSTVETEVTVPGHCVYWVAFIDRARLLAREDRLMRRPLASQIGFESDAVAASMSSLRSELAYNDELSSLYLDAWAMQTFVLMHRSPVQMLPDRERRLGRSQLSKVIGFMEANIASDITLDSLAKVIDVSPRHLRRLFVASSGVTPSEMLTAIRLERAACDLRHSRKSVTEISMDCGFSQPQHLATAFRRKYGLTPTAFRHQAANLMPVRREARGAGRREPGS